MNITDAQRPAWKNKLDKGFNPSDIPMEFGLLTAEIGEAFTAWRKGLPDRGEEIADVFLYLAAIAEMQGAHSNFRRQPIGAVSRTSGRPWL